MAQNTKINIKNKKSGFTLIEALVVLFIFALITLSFYSLLSVGTKYIQDARNRLGALSVANEKMEAVRNLQYDNIGTVGGTISGNIQQNEIVSENNKRYDVVTEIEYIDDPLDGTDYSDEVWFEDYKKVTITVAWNNGFGGSGNVKLTSRFVPPGLEVKKPGDGILVINIFSDQPGGTGIPSSSVHIENTETGLDINKTTDSSGSIILMGDTIADSIQKYQITAVKSGYETVRTMPPYPDTAEYSPIDVHASVVTGSLNIINIVQNKLVNLKISAADYLDNPIGNIGFDISGGRKLGYKVVDGIVTSDPFYSFSSSTETGSNGEKDFGLMSPGQYTMGLASSATDAYEIIGKYPLDPINLFSETDLNFRLKLASKTTTSLLVKVKSDTTDNPPVSGAEVQLTNSLGYDVTQTTGADGILFFPKTSDVFQDGEYNLKITASGFVEKNSTLTINPNQLKVESVVLTSS